MTVIARNFLPEQGIPYVIEDPDDGQDRIWINTQGYVSSTLVPLFDKPNSVFNRQFLRPYASNTAYIGVGASAYTVNNYAPRPIITNRGVIHNNFYSTTSPIWSTYHWSLDFAYYPMRNIWKSQNNVFIAQDANYLATSTVGGNYASSALSYREFRLGDFTNPVTSTNSDVRAGTPGVSSTMTGIVYEDVINSRLYGYAGDKIQYASVRFTSGAYDTISAGVSDSATVATVGATYFFVGADTFGHPYFVYADSTVVAEPFTLYKFAGAAQTTVIAQTGAAATTNYTRPFPSNVRRDSASRRVFYYPMFNASNDFVPRRIVWDPTQANTATLTACTMTYASGTYSTYSKKIAGVAVFHSGVNIGNNYNTWKFKPHQFKVGSNWYITFIGSDFTYTAGRWPDNLTLTALTYSIGAGTADDQLTYHSGFLFTSTTLPRDWIPINSDGNKLAIIQQDSKVGFMTFNEVGGWSITSTYDVASYALGIDKYWRVWISTSDPANIGNGLVHMVTTGVPITATVTLASSSYNYQGTNIATTATVNAYDYTNARVVTSIDLTITGSGMVFTSNSGKTLTVTTSASADTTVNLTVNGSGVSNIVASVAI